MSNNPTLSLGSKKVTGVKLIFVWNEKEKYKDEKNRQKKTHFSRLSSKSAPKKIKFN